ncbi:hypothetical protein [Acinetobacter sp. SWBY1]|uniref:hypothetical protein n=1 Tax=Acinetobacter sp. SWBY1 TaxID=2079596 RepID=UPI000CF2B550|nr:hypothetical protein [Acinetobacter sp. SWBY1]AVH48684.1 hypothetical protein C3Y93_03085 [Acinetobacter sp. SWBY1]
MEIQNEKEAFEAWFESRYDAHFMQFALDLDFYVDKHTQTCWEAWQAAKAQAIPDGFVLVPKEPTDKTIARMINTPIEVNLLCDHADIFLSEGEAYIAYQAMIEAQEPAK